MKTQTIAFIGAGNMAEALIKGLLRAGRREARADRRHRPARPSGCASCESAYGIRVRTDNLEAVRQAEVVVLSVKPQVMGKMLDAGRPGDRHARKLVISIAAGVPIAAIERKLGQARGSSARCRTPRRWSAPGRPRSPRASTPPTRISGGQGALRRGGKDGRPRRVAARRGHRPLRERPGLHLPDHRGALGRRGEGRPPPLHRAQALAAQTVLGSARSCSSRPARTRGSSRTRSPPPAAPRSPGCTPWRQAACGPR